MDDQDECPPRRRSQHDLTDIAAALANRVVLEALSAIARKRQDERDGTHWVRLQPLLAGRNGAIPEGHIPHQHTHGTHDQTHDQTDRAHDITPEEQG